MNAILRSRVDVDLLHEATLCEYLPHVIAPGIANNDPAGIADNERDDEMGLPSSDIAVSGDSHGQVNELDTYKGARLGPSIVSRILRYLKGILNVFIGSPYYGDCLEPFTCSNIGDVHAQGPKAINPNEHSVQPRDLIAYEYNLYLMRGRSFHSSVSAKGSSQNSTTQPSHDFNLDKDRDSSNLATDDESPQSVDS